LSSLFLTSSLFFFALSGLSFFPWFSFLLPVFASLIAYVTAKRVAIAVTYIVVAASLFFAMSGLVKAAILGLRVSIPSSLAAGTFLLPPSINSFVAALFTIRLTYFLWTWTNRNLTAYVNAQNSSPL